MSERENAVDIARRYGLGVLGFGNRWGQIFGTHPAGFESPHSLLYKVTGPVSGAWPQPPPCSVGFEC
jgi:hypothetical protein